MPKRHSAEAKQTAVDIR